MPDTFLWVMLPAVDLSLIALVFELSRRKGRRVDAARVFFMLLLPFFGPVSILLLTRSDGSAPPDGEWMKRNEDQYQSIMALGAGAAQTVPIEEALLINDAKNRRTLMMNMLRSDPRKYMDVLLIARFNEDPETAHYATATLLELQHQTQLNIQRLQAALIKNPRDEETRAQYIRALAEYCDSGLLEAQLLRRQRLLLAGALEDGFRHSQTPEMMSLSVRNLLSLGEPSKARASARRMLMLWPTDERSWLDMMRVYAQTRDQDGMRALLNEAQEAKVEWTASGYEKLQYWMGKAS